MEKREIPNVPKKREGGKNYHQGIRELLSSDPIVDLLRISKTKVLLFIFATK